ncbi:MAG: ABC transporter permease [Oscillospiraceae bacterium]|jgi:simple sugar transport system permease protein|nr:ABC transporter permease [Oscillospiraceae bacterium]
MLDNPRFKKFLTGSAVPLLFLAISLVSALISQITGVAIIRDVVERLSRDSFLVLSLILPVIAGMGINFGMVLGAMAAQIGLVFVLSWGVPGVPGLLLAALIGTPISVLLGWFGGMVLNRAKGREMITSMMLGLFISGVYQFFLLYMCGTVIPIPSTKTVLSQGYGIRNSLALEGVKKAFDNILKLRVGTVIIPVGTFAIVGLLCLFTWWFRNTRMGQNMRATGQDMGVSESAGINVEKNRIQSIIISTVLACYGQIIYLQNIGSLNTYNGADQAALFAAAALLVGGASVSHATIWNAILGTSLFHLMFVVLPKAGANLTGSAQIGEYLRMFVSYAVVTTALVIHAWKQQKDKETDRLRLRQRRN